MDLFDEISDEFKFKMATGVPPASPFAFWIWFLPLVILCTTVFVSVAIAKVVSVLQKPSRPHAMQKAEGKNEIQAEASR